jgi:nitroreductase
MSFLELVNKRQSVRAYEERSVPRDILERCLEAARLSPSACNSQPWSFIVVDDPDLRKKVADSAFSGIYSMNTFAKAAPVLVVIVRDKAGYLSRIGGQFRDVKYSLVDIGIAIEHFVLQAADEGVGTCWLGWFDEGAVKRILGIPRDRRADMMLSVGFPADDEVRPKARKALGEISRFNRA